MSGDTSDGTDSASVSIDLLGRRELVSRYEGVVAPADGSFDRIASMATAIFNAPIATVSIVDEDRVWFAATRGLDGITHVGTEPGLCTSAVLCDGPYVVNDAQSDPRTIHHPLVRGALGVRFYAAARIVVAGGHVLGTVDVIDRKRRRVNGTQLGLLSDLADTVAQMLQIKLAALSTLRRERTLMAAELSRLEAADLHQQASSDIRWMLPDGSQPSQCELGGSTPCARAAELKVTDSWGDSAWGCWEHAEDAIRQVPSVFLAESPAFGLRQYRERTTYS